MLVCPNHDIDAVLTKLRFAVRGCPGYHRRLPPLILALNRDCLARLAMRACLAAAVAVLALAGARDHTQGTRPRPR
jgi:hypothetical protein